MSDDTKEVNIECIGDKFRASVTKGDWLMGLSTEYTIVLSEDGGAFIDFYLHSREELEKYFSENEFTVDRGFLSYESVMGTSSLLEEEEDVYDVYEEALMAVENAESLIITGAPGTGKTELLGRVASLLHEELLIPLDRIAVCALSGVAATNINAKTNDYYNATTLHGALGIDRGDEHLPIKDVIRKRARLEDKRRKQARKRGFEYEAKEIQVIVADETLSLMSASLFRLVVSLYPDAQLIFFGDPVQLKPVKTKDDPEGAGRYLFEDVVLFDKVFGNNIFELTENWRLQNADPGVAKQWLEMLAEIRNTGYVGDRNLDMLRNMSSDDRDITPQHMCLFARNVDVNHKNQQEINKMVRDSGRIKKQLPMEVVYTRTDDKAVGVLKQQEPIMYEDLPTEFSEKVKEHLTKFKPIEITKGAKIRLTKNINIVKNLVNGSLGTILEISPMSTILSVDFGEHKHDLKMVEVWNLCHRTEDGVMWYATCTMHPIQLGYAMTVHKSIGLTVQTAVDLTHMGSKNPGLAYVALSRTPDPTKCIVDNVVAIVNEELVSPLVRTFYEMVEIRTTKRREEVAKGKNNRGPMPIADEWSLRNLPDFEEPESYNGYVTLHDIITEQREAKRKRVG
jgi:ATP-dependent exoDNAse (exonuclease V) alpha subunit